MKLSYETYKRIIFAITAVIIVNILKPTSMMGIIGVAATVGILLGLLSALLELTVLKK